jgi:hypothetical protein
MRTKPTKRARSWLTRRDPTRSNLQAAILTGTAIAFVLVLMTAIFTRHERFLKSHMDEWASLPWDPAWPALPVLDSARTVRIDVARAIYAFAGTKPEILQYIPCYCGCRSQGHRSNHDCYVKGRSTEGRVIEWTNHGLTWPLTSRAT